MEAAIFQFLPVPFRSPSGILPVCGVLDYHFPQGLTQFHSPSGMRGSLPVTQVNASPVSFRCPSGGLPVPFRCAGKVHAIIFNADLCQGECVEEVFFIDSYIYIYMGRCDNHREQHKKCTKVCNWPYMPQKRLNGLLGSQRCRLGIKMAPLGTSYGMFGVREAV